MQRFGDHKQKASMNVGLYAASTRLTQPTSKRRRELSQKGAVELQYISTDDQTVDVLTKSLPRVKFEYFCGRLGVEENVSLLERER